MDSCLPPRPAVLAVLLVLGTSLAASAARMMERLDRGVVAVQPPHPSFALDESLPLPPRTAISTPPPQSAPTSTQSNP